MNDHLPPPDLDLTRLAYVAKYSAETLDLSQAQLQRLSGCSARQVSYFMNGKPICAGATHVLAAVLDIDLDMMLPVDTQLRIKDARRMHREFDGVCNPVEKQSLTPPVKRETEAAE